MNGESAVAVLTRSRRCRMGTDRATDRGGLGAADGPAEAESGLVQLEFYGGAIVVLEGPADLELLAVDRAFCRRGRLRVRASHQSSQFSVETPNADVIDLGTEFGVRVDDAVGSEVQVFEGSVELHRRAALGLRAPGGGWRSARGCSSTPPARCGRPAPTPDRSSARMELERRCVHRGRPPLPHWLDLSRRLQSDPRVVLDYSFEGQALGTDAARPVPGRLGRARRGDRRQPVGRGALAGQGGAGFQADQRPHPGQHPGCPPRLTLMAWVRVDGLDRASSARC